jgi:DNA-binding transcriptional LysR family regulator
MGHNAMDRLDGLNAFVKVGELGSFSAAAKRLGWSKSAVSKQVAALEERLGATLLHRTTRAMSLTEAGTAFLARARALLAELAEAEAAVASLSGELQGTLWVNAPLSFGIRHVAPAVAPFLAAHPKLALELDLTDRFVDLVEEGYDLALRIGALADSSLIARKLAPVRRLLCAAPGYLARAGLPQTPQALAAHACLSYRQERRSSAWTLEREGERLQIGVSGPLTTNNGDVLLEAARAGAGIVDLPTFYTCDDLRDGRLLPVLPEWHPPSLALYAVYPPNRHLSVKVRRFIDDFAARLGPDPYWDRVNV